MKYSNHLSANKKKSAKYICCCAVLLCISFLPANGQANFYHSAPAIQASVFNNATGEYEVSWDEVTDADEYQLEWVHINNYDISEESKLEYDFKNNSTRVSIKAPATSYGITSLFEQGYLLCRVRAINYLDPQKTQIVASKWSNADKGTVDSFEPKITITEADAHTLDSLNWQYISNYAEGGKKKEVVSYYDGSMRSRQLVTRINSEQKNAVVGETFYDHQGRAAIQTLPVPADESVLKYYNKFNQSPNDSVYGRNSFDKDSDAPCAVAADSMSTASGASRYYSSANPDANKDFNKYIPDAGGYPFSQTEYEPDNTGRIRRQGGVGKTYQLGSLIAGYHPTTYFYGKPSQEELNRMFASEAGNKSYYQKNVVQDANGQMSVSYLDMQGKVVATSLAGGTPDAMEALASKQNGKRLEISILDNQPIAVGATKYTSVYHHISTTADIHDFSYRLPASSLSSIHDASLPEEVCLSCVYDLVIDIKDECGKRPQLTDFPAGITPGDSLPVRITLGNMENITCDSIGDIKFDFKARFEEGKYTISRTISVKSDAHIDNYLKQHINLVNIRDVIDKKIAEANLDIACEEPQTCEQKCLFDNNPEDCILKCKLEEEYTGNCEQSASMLAADYIPTRVMSEADRNLINSDTLNPTRAEAGGVGQYALYKVVENAIVEKDGNDTLSVSYTYTYSADDVYSAYDIFSNFAATLTYLKTIYPADSALYSITNNSDGIKKFIEVFNPQWAETLAVYFHPEKDCLAACNDSVNQKTQRFDFIVRNTDSYTEAYNRGLLNPLGLSNLNPLGSNNPQHIPSHPDYLDPFFDEDNGPGKDYSGVMKTYMTDGSRVYEDPKSGNQLTFSSLWEQAVYMAYRAELDTLETPAIVDSCKTRAKKFVFDPAGQHGANTCSCVRDRVWENFRALYLGKKSLIEASMPDNSCRGNVPQGKQARIQPPYTSSELAIIADSETAQSTDALGIDPDAGVDSICRLQAEAQVDNILYELAGCLDTVNTVGGYALWNDSNAQYVALREAFVEIMVASCDGANMFGASDLPPNAPSLIVNNKECRSFADAMEAVLDPSQLSLLCNPDLISFPKKYGYEYNSRSNYKIIDSCGCNLLLKAETEFAERHDLPPGITSGKKYFAWAYGYEIENYQGKLCLCDKALIAGLNTGNEDAKAILANSREYMPTELNCDVCIDCNMITAAMAEFESTPWMRRYYQLMDFFGTSLSESNRQRAMVNFMNNKFNLDKSYLDYMAHLQKCTESDSLYCELSPEALSLQTLLNDVLSRGRITDTICGEAISRDIRNSKLDALLPACACEEYSFEASVDNGNKLSMKIAGAQGCSTDCSINLEFTDTIDYELANIVPVFENIRPAEEYRNSNDGKYYFYIDVKVGYGVSIVPATMLGSVCFPIENCYDGTDKSIKLCDREEQKRGSCKEDMMRIIVKDVETLYKEYADSITAAFVDIYSNQCLANTEGKEIFTAEYTDSERHFTLYYYDQAGNLIKTIPPEGVEFVPAEQWADVDKDRKAGTQTVFTKHRLETRYLYNSLNQLTAQYMPDHDAFDGRAVNGAANLAAGMTIASTLFADNMNGVLFGSNPNDPTQSLTYSTTDGGASWKAVEAFGLTSFNALAQDAAKQLWAVGDNGNIISRGSDNKWRVQDASGVSGDLTGIYFDGNTGYMYSNDGRIYSKNGNFWSIVNGKRIGSNFHIEKIVFQNGAAIAAGEENGQGVVYESTDFITWSKSTIKSVLPEITAIHLYSDSEGYAFCSNGLIAESNNGGEHWKVKTQMYNPVEIRKVHFFSANNGIAMDSDKRLLFTENSGKSWKASNLTGADAFAVVPNTSIAYAVKDNVLYQMRNDTTWIMRTKQLLEIIDDKQIVKTVAVTIPGNKVCALYVDNSAMYAIDVAGNVLKTTDVAWDTYTHAASLANFTEPEVLYVSENNAALTVMSANKKWDTGNSNTPDTHNKGYSAVSSGKATGKPLVAIAGLMYSEDNLAAFKPLQIKALRDVATNGTLSVAAGYEGTVLRKEAGGWSFVTTGVAGNLSAVAINNSSVLIGADNGELYKFDASSAGDWNNPEIDSYGAGITAIETINSTSYISTNEGYVYRAGTEVPVYRGGKIINDLLAVNGSIIAAGSDGAILSDWNSQAQQIADARIIDAAR
ncbi:MAG: DUF6443 domain-containing protein, partial [Prevotellaceae bacterium]|nr:DUF6443 domain-containing protein [Prevotellaceae bacterium]